MKIIKEFKDFAVKGNMMDMAIGIIIGASFKSVVNVLVKKIIMPPLDLVTNGINLKDKKLVLKEATETTTELAIGYGEFLEVFSTFIVIGILLFIVVKSMNKYKKKAEDTGNKEVETPKDIELLTKIVDLLEEKNRNKLY